MALLGNKRKLQCCLYDSLLQYTSEYDVESFMFLSKRQRESIGFSIQDIILVL